MTKSCCEYENACPMCTFPETVGGGVSTEYISLFDFELNWYIFSFSQNFVHFSSAFFASYFFGASMSLFISYRYIKFLAVSYCILF